MAPASTFAASSKPNVAYLDLNLAALLKKQTTLPSLAYAGIPYQVFGQRSGADSVMISWSRLAIARSFPFIVGDRLQQVAFPVRPVLVRARFRLQLLGTSLHRRPLVAVNPLCRGGLLRGLLLVIM